LSPRINDSPQSSGRFNTFVQSSMLPKNGPTEQAVLDLVVLRASQIGLDEAGLA
jgi:hypothetical protein